MNKDLWVKVFKNGPSKVCRRQCLKVLKRCGLPKQFAQVNIKSHQNGGKASIFCLHCELSNEKKFSNFSCSSTDFKLDICMKMSL